MKINKWVKLIFFQKCSKQIVTQCWKLIRLHLSDVQTFYQFNYGCVISLVDMKNIDS